MQFAPFLLQSFAARFLATQAEAKTSIAELVKQGYDVEILLEMIRDYNRRTDAEREFEIKATRTEIHLKRKTSTVPPAHPTLSTPNKPSPVAVPAKPAAPLPVVLKTLLRTITIAQVPQPAGKK